MDPTAVICIIVALVGVTISVSALLKKRSKEESPPQTSRSTITAIKEADKRTRSRLISQHFLTRGSRLFLAQNDLTVYDILQGDYPPNLHGEVCGLICFWNSLLRDDVIPLPEEPSEEIIPHLEEDRVEELDFSTPIPEMTTGDHTGGTLTYVPRVPESELREAFSGDGSSDDESSYDSCDSSDCDCGGDDF